MNLSKSKYCLGLQCSKILWLDKNKPEGKEDIKNESVLDNGTMVGIVAKDLFKGSKDIEFNPNLNKMLADTNKLMQEENVIITEASFVYQNNFCSVDILKKEGPEIELYEVKSSTALKDIYYEDLTYQVYVLYNLGYKIKKASLVYLNSEYVRGEKLELDKLFKIKDITEFALNRLEIVKENINKINEDIELKEEPTKDIDYYCFKPYDCPFFKYCTKHLPANNVFDIRRMNTKKKLELYHKGSYSYQDLLKENIDYKFKEQIDFTLNNKEPKIEIASIKEFLNTLSYPLYFLDFETFQQAIPEYIGVKPYMQIPFQYSLHYIEKENGKLKHKEFLADANIDPRRSLALSLVKNIPKNVCILAYNMSFEKNVIKNLALEFPDLQEHLMNIHDNIKDLMLPFINRNYYVKEMEGSYSIKYVLPALFPHDENLNYHNLDLIHNGSEAMNAYHNLGQLSLKEQEKIRERLLKYCELDTYAMVKIWEKLKEVTSLVEI